MDESHKLDASCDGLDAWWEEFLKQKEEAANASLEGKLETVQQLRQVFIKERQILLQLYEPVRHMLMDVLKDDKQHRGGKMYDEWGRIHRKECLLSYYDNEYFRAMYAGQRFLNSATSFLQALALRILPESPAVEEYLAQVTRVISVGVGPGSDIAAFLAYARTRGLNQKLVYYTLDQCQDWGKYMCQVDRKWSVPYNVSIWFKQCRFGKRDIVDMLPDADLLVFSFANTSLMDPAIWPLLQHRYRLIIVLDGIKEVLIDGFGESSFKKFQLNERTNVYYSFCPDSDGGSGSQSPQHEVGSGGGQSDVGAEEKNEALTVDQISSPAN